MKKLRQIMLQTKILAEANATGFNDMLWQLICYPPRMPIRHPQEALMNAAERFTLTVPDDHFAHHQLTFNGFKWGTGKRKILLTHGWGSKAADLGDIIEALRTIDDVQVIAFDAPGNGSSEAELSNLLLFVLAVEAIIREFGSPDVLIGHSLGVMANVIAIRTMELKPALLASITPLVKLKENFETSMNAVGVQQQAQDEFFESFEALFNYPASYFNLTELYTAPSSLNHWLAYDESDLVAPYAYLKAFLTANPAISVKNYNEATHERILKSEAMIADLLNEVENAIT
jgi:pimeloyl-ACP methyl ester carboxylesterase